MKSNKDLFLFGGLAVEKQVSNNTRVTFDIDIMSKADNTIKIINALKQNNINFKDKYKSKTKGFTKIKIKDVEKTTISILDENNKDPQGEPLKIDLVHPKIDISHNKILIKEE